MPLVLQRDHSPSNVSELDRLPSDGRHVDVKLAAGGNAECCNSVGDATATEGERGGKDLAQSLQHLQARASGMASKLSSFKPTCFDGDGGSVEQPGPSSGIVACHRRHRRQRSSVALIRRG